MLGLLRIFSLAGPIKMSRSHVLPDDTNAELDKQSGLR